VVTAAAALSGADGCAAQGTQALAVVPVDDVCYRLVRTLAERAGALTAVLTAVLMLTVVGLSRIMSGPETTTRSTDRMA
jgi:hypothetical protein